MSFSIRNSKVRSETGKRGFVLIFLVLLATSAFSQENAARSFSGDRFSEELYISTDRDLYIAGEDVWMKIYKLNRKGHSPADISKIVYIDLLDIHNNPVIQLKAGIDSKSGSSGFVLPDTLSTGYYIIRSYTNWMKNFSEDLYSYKRISVINPFDVSKLRIPEPNSNPDSLGRSLLPETEKEGIELSAAGKEKNSYNKPENNINFDIKVQNSGSKREKVILTITATDKNGDPVESDFSLSVVKSFTANLLNNNFCQSPGLIPDSDAGPSDINEHLIIYTPDNQLNNLNNQPLFLPELEGHLISGSLKNRKSGLPLKNEYISLSFVGKIALCQFTKTDENGNFNFVTSENGLREIVIQPLSSELNDYYVDLNSSFTTAYNNFYQNPFRIDTAILDDINNAIISMQINKIYEPFSQQLPKKEVETEKRDFYGAPDDIIHMSSYIELTSLKEVIKEILPGVSTVKKNDKTRFRLINKNQSMAFDNDPLVLIDGVPVNDIEKIININSREIERIDVLTSRYFISDIVLDGILHFVSKSGNLHVIDFDRSVYRLQYELPQSAKEFYSPVYSSDTARNSRIPDFRNTLYWQPMLHTDKTGNASIEFYSSDESADYSIVIEGIASDGRTGKATSALKIKQ
jgi:hypothetical protein